VSVSRESSVRPTGGSRVRCQTSDSLLRKEVSVTVKYAFICGEEGNYPIEKMCSWAKVSRSGYYEWRGRGLSPSRLRRRRLSALVPLVVPGLRRHLRLPPGARPPGPAG